MISQMPIYREIAPVTRAPAQLGRVYAPRCMCVMTP